MRALVLCVAFVSCVHIVCGAGHSQSSSDEGREPDDLSSSSEYKSTVRKPGSSTVSSPPPQGGLLQKFSLGNVPNQLAAMGEKIRQNAYNVAGVLYETAHPVRTDINRHAYHTAGAFFETGGPMRKAVANNNKVKQGGIVKKIWDKLDFKGKSREDKIKLLVHVLSEELANHVPLYTKIQPLEIKGKSKYVCGVKGLMRDLRTIEKVDSDTENTKDNGLKIIIDYTFKDLHFNYTKFHIHALGMKGFSADGSLDLKFGDNKVRITLQIPSFKEILKNVVMRRCIVTVLNFEVITLKLKHSTLSGRKEGNRRKILSGRVRSFLFKNQEFLRAKFEQRTLVEIHRALVTRDHWVCKSKDFGELVRRKQGSLEAFVPTYPDRFLEHCGDDYFIEPYEKPQDREESDTSSV